jgi:hypothetical protein
MTISGAIIQKLLLLLRPHLQDDMERKGYLIRALGTRADELNLIWNQPVNTFVPNMVHKLVVFGEITPGKPALCALLEVMREDGGVGFQSSIDELLGQIREEYQRPENLLNQNSNKVTDRGTSIELSILQENADLTRRALNPITLDRIPRKCVKLYLQEISNSVGNNEEQKVIAIIGDAGYGKTTIMGDIYDHMRAKVGWIAIVRCDNLYLEPNLSIEYLATALGKYIYDNKASDSITNISSNLTKNYGRGVLLIDTLDLVLNQTFIEPFHRVLRELTTKGTTVVFTCRDYEYDHILKPDVKLYTLPSKVKGHRVPRFSKWEIMRAAQAFFKKSKNLDAINKGKEFGRRIVKLSAHDYQLREIICKPLLLRMLCELCEDDGVVPQNLTVSKLYELYWNERIAQLRPNSNLPIEVSPAEVERKQEKLCWNVAKAAFESSYERLELLVRRSDIEEIERFDKIDNLAYEKIRSEGVLIAEKNQVDLVRFFHQSFMEYAIALWLDKREAKDARERLLETLRNPDAWFDWWRIMREYLTIARPGEFQRIIDTDQLDMSNDRAFYAVAFAAASRNEPSALEKLLPTALERGGHYQQILFEAAISTPTCHAEVAWKVILTLLRKGEYQIAANIVQKSREMLARLKSNLGSCIDAALLAIKECSVNTNAESGRQANELFGWFINKSCYPLLLQSIDLQALETLRKHYSLYSTETRCKVIELHLGEEVLHREQHQLLHIIIPYLATSEKEERKRIEILIKNVLHHLFGDVNFTNWDSLKAKLSFPLENNKKADMALARGVGLWSATNYNLIYQLLKDLGEGDSRDIRLSRDAIDEAISNGAGDLVVSILLELFNSYIDIPKQRRLPIVSLFQGRIIADKKTKGKVSENPSKLLRVSSFISWEPRRRLAEWFWFASRKEEDPIKFLGILIALSEDLPEMQKKVKQLINELGQKANTVISRMHFVPEYVEQYIQIMANDKESKKALVKIQSLKIRTSSSEENISRLIERAKDFSDKVARHAAQELMTFVGKQKRPDVDDWISVLESSNFSGVRRYCLDALNQLVKQGMNDKHLTRIWVNLLSKPRKSKLEETQKMGDLVANWIEFNNCITPKVTEIIDGIVQYLQTNANGDMAGALFKAFKTITRTHERTILCPKLIEWTRTLLISINIKTINNGRSEVAQVLRLIDDIDPAFLGMVVEKDCPNMSLDNKEENVCAVVQAIHKCGGTKVNLLDYVRRSEWCPPKAIALIAKFQLKG